MVLDLIPKTPKVKYYSLDASNYSNFTEVLAGKIPKYIIKL